MSAARVQRYDIGSVEQPAKPVPTSQGFLIVEGFASRAGVFDYQMPDGTIRRELRRRKDVFEARSLQSYEGAPFTNDHPGVRVTSENVSRYSSGTVLGPARQVGDMVGVRMVVQDKACVQDLIERRKKELSSGYSVVLLDESGIDAEFGRYDAVQTEIEINHLALVDAGRAGPMAKVHMDSLRMDAASAAQAAIMVPRTDASGNNSHRGEPSMGNENKNDQDSPETLRALLNTANQQLVIAKKRGDNLEAELAAATARADKAEGSVDSLKKDLTKAQAERGDSAVLELKDAQIRKLEKERDDANARAAAALDPTKEKERAKERADLIATAGVFLEDTKDVSSMENDAIRIAVVKAIHGDDMTGKSSDYIKGRFDSAVGNAAEFARSMDGLRELVPATKNDTKHADDPRAAYIDQQRNGWRNPKKSNPSKEA